MQTAIEVELGPFSLEDEAKALLYADELIIAVKEESVLHETKMKLEGFPPDMRTRISICLIDELLSILRPNYNINTRGNISLERNKRTSTSVHGNEYGNEGNK